MVALKLAEPFLDIPAPELPESIDGFVLDTIPYELMMAEAIHELDPVRNLLIRLDLEEDFDFLGGADLASYRALVPHFYSKNEMPLEDLLALADKYKSINEPNVMEVEDLEELASHILAAYQVAYAHYVLGEKKIGKFPKLSCKISSRNIVLSLIEHGYLNTSFVYDNSFGGYGPPIPSDHAIVVLPFVMQEVHGVIGIDPTSDQYYGQQRNNVFVKLGNIWTYSINGREFNPESVIAIDNLPVLQDLDNAKKDDNGFHKDGTTYLQKAYSNPVSVDVGE